MVSGRGSEGCSLERILLTHGHTDHYGGACEIQRRWGPVPVGMMDAGFSTRNSGPAFLVQMAARGIDAILDGGEAWLARGDTGIIHCHWLSLAVIP